MASLEKTESRSTKRSTSLRADFLDRVITTTSSIRSKFALRSVHASGPGTIFNPTNVRLRMIQNPSDGGQCPASDVALLWRSRDNRKGRVSVAVPRRESQDSSTRPRFTASGRQVRKGVIRMFTVFPYYDMAYWVGFSFSIGSAIFVGNGLICLMPVAYPGLGFENKNKYGSGISGIIGVFFFQVGATLAYLEACNDGSFHGSVMRRFLEGNEDEEKQLVKLKLQSFFQSMMPRRDRSASEDSNFGPPGWPTPPTTSSIRRRGALDLGAEGESTHEYSGFRWWPTWTNLKNHYIFEIGWLACTVQFVGATLYMVGGFTGLPGVLMEPEPWQENLALWIPNMVASVGFMSASLLFTLETQDKWYKPQPRILGWWIGFFAFIGSVGFELCAAFGPAAHDHEWAEYQSDLATTWGSGCFLIASLLQWYEAVNKSTVEELYDEPADMKSFDVQQVHV